MSKFNAVLARQLDFGVLPAKVTSTSSPARAGPRLASGAPVLSGPNKYRVLEHRRRQAQIHARRLLEAAT